MSAHAGSVAEFLRQRVAEGWMPGAAWRVDDPAGCVDRGVVGHAAVEPEPVVLGDATPFDLASLTKSLCTAPLLLLLDQQGALALDDPVGRWVSELDRSRWRDATLFELATHRSGMPAWEPLFLGGGGLPDYLDRIAALEPAVRRGRVLYSDPGYILLGVAIERAAGESLDRLFASLLAAPLGLERVGFASDGRFADAAATERGNGYERELAAGRGEDHPWRTAVIRGEVHDANAHGLGGVAGHAGLFAGVDDVAGLARGLTEQSPVGLDAAHRRLMLEPRPEAGTRTVGWVVARGSGAARDVLPPGAPGHTGFSGTSAWVDPGRGRSYVLLTNRVHPIVDRHRDFQVVRREFHRHAARAAGPSG